MGPVEIIAIVLAVLCVGAAIAVPIVRKKKGKSGCGYDCSACSHGCSACRAEGKQKDND